MNKSNINKNNKTKLNIPFKDNLNLTKPNVGLKIPPQIQSSNLIQMQFQKK